MLLRLTRCPPDWLVAVKLPNAHLVVVESEKIASYLLNPGHRFGASKARFFVRFGFRIDKWQVLAEALQEHGAAMNSAISSRPVLERAMRLMAL